MENKKTLISITTALLLLGGCGGGDSTSVPEETIQDVVQQQPENNETNTTQNRTPQFTLPADGRLSVVENQVEIGKIEASLADAYAIVAGADAPLFTIDNAGELKFSHFVPDFEHPSDSNHDNIYEVTIAASNSDANVTQAFKIEVSDDPSDDNAGAAVVLKTGMNDGPNGPGYGDPRDTPTGLKWEDSAHVETDVTWDEAASYCASIGKRLPTRKELFTLVNYGKFAEGKPVMDDWFEHKNKGIFWTSTSLLRGDRVVNSKAWAIEFRFGGDDVYDKTESVGMHVRCVSGAATFSTTNSFKDEGLTIKDTTTGLIWEHDEQATLQKMTWQEAKDRCEAKGLDWRLPNINELHTLLPENSMNILLVNIIGDMPYSTDPIWSSTEVPGNPKQALYIGNYEYNAGDDLHYGDTQNDEQDNKDLDGSIRSICVRGGHL